MNLKKTFTSLTTNKYFLYFIVIITAFNIIGYLAMHNSNAVIFFSLVGFITYNFSKNMTIVLLVSIVATNLLMVSSPFQSLEGFNKQKNNMTDAMGGGLEGFNKQKNKMSDAMGGGLEGFDKTKQLIQDATGGVDGFKKNKDKKEKWGKEPFSDLRPAPVKKSSHIDYATTLEDAYKNLEQMLGNGGLQNLTEDTKNLMKQQSQLFSSMENITPLLAQAQTMMKGMDMDSINKFANLKNQAS